MFSVRLVARPDARMVEVPLEIEAELPREFEGAALLAASGLPRKVKLKAQKDALKLSTAYRADQLVADIVRSALRGTALDVQRVQEAVTKFIRTVRERRQEGAALLVSSNGRGKFEVFEQFPKPARGGSPPPAPGDPARLPAPPADRVMDLERRIVELEATLARGAGGDWTGRVAQLEERVATLQAQLARTGPSADLAGSGFEQERPGAKVIPRSASSTRRPTAVEAYAEGLRHEILASAAAAFGRARLDTERCDKAAALAAEAEFLGAPIDGTAVRLRDASALAAARQNALELLSQEVEFYQHAELPVAAQLLERLEHSSGAPDPGPSIELVAQAVVRAAKGGDAKSRTAWLNRGAALCTWKLVEPAPGETVDPEWHHVLDSGGNTVVRLACPGVKRADGSGLVRARVHVDPEAARLPLEPDDPAAVPEPLSPPASVPPPPPSAERPPLDGPAAAAVAPFGDLAGEGEIRPDEAAAAAVAASRIPKIVSGDPSGSDEALAAEVALSAEAQRSSGGGDAQAAGGPEAIAARPEGPDEIETEVIAWEEIEEIDPDAPPEDTGPAGK